MIQQFKAFTYLLVSFMYLFSFLQAQNEENKTVFLAILARNKAHVLPTYLKCIENLDYNKKLITIYINTNNNQDQTKQILENWVQENQERYAQVIFETYDILDNPITNPHEWNNGRLKILGKIRNKSLLLAQQCKNDYYFVVDCDNFIKNHTLKDLLKKNKPIIAPFLKAIPEPYDTYSNYFCAVDSNGYFAPHPDFEKIQTRELRGTLKVPLVHCTYLINTIYLDQLTYDDQTKDYEFVIFSRSARNNQIDQYICNEQDFGFLLHFYKNLTLKQEVQAFKRISQSLSLYLEN